MRSFKTWQPNRRHLWIAAAVAVGLAASPLLLLPTLVRNRVASMVDARLGLHSQIDGVRFGWSGLSLSGLHLRGQDSEALQIDVAGLDLELSWLAVPFGGSSAVSALSAEGIDADIDLSSKDYQALRAKLRSGTGSTSAGTHTARKLRASRFALTVREGTHELLTVDGAHANVGPSEITALINRMRASRPGLATAALSGVELVAQRKDGVQLEKLQVDDATLSIEAQLPMHGATAAKPADDEPDDDAAPSNAAPPPVAAPAAGTDRRASVQSLFARLTQNAQVELKRARVEQVSGKTRVPVLNDVACTVTRQPDNALRITGKGATQAGGRLDADMKVWPTDLRADGRITLQALPLTLLVPVLPSVPWYEPETSRIDASLLIRAESPARVALEGRADLRGVNLYAERIATVPVLGLSIGIAGRGHWLPLERRLEIETGSFALGKARVAVKGAVELAADHYAFDIDANLPPTSCTDAVRSIPAELLGDMALAQWRGTIASKLRFQTDSRELDKTVLNVDITDHCDFQVVPVMADLSRFASPFTHSVTEPDDSVFEMETGPGTPNWTPIEAMSPYFVHAVLLHEDPGFFSHRGFSLINIRNALVRDLHERRYAVGASTITMQLVKNVFLHREKTLARKIQEVLLTWWTERVMDKRDILELYLNVIEYGPSIYGVRNAAKHYWNRLPSELSPAEAVFLANILPAPKKFHSYYDHNALSASWTSTMRKFIQRLGERGAYDKAATDFGVAELDHFHFAREGEAAPPRTVPGSASPLPYQEAQQETFDTSTFAQPRQNLP